MAQGPLIRDTEQGSILALKYLVGSFFCFTKVFLPFSFYHAFLRFLNTTSKLFPLSIAASTSLLLTYLTIHLSGSSVTKPTSPCLALPATIRCNDLLLQHRSITCIYTRHSYFILQMAAHDVEMNRKRRPGLGSSQRSIMINRPSHEQICFYSLKMTN